jgi:hypothetical protein
VRPWAACQWIHKDISLGGGARYWRLAKRDQAEDGDKSQGDGEREASKAVFQRS